MNGKIERTACGSEKQPTDVVAIVLLWLLWTLSVVPLVVLFIEFGEPSIACVGASYYAKLYGHIFVYPATFGFFATIFLTRPQPAFAKAWSRYRVSGVLHRGNCHFRELGGFHESDASALVVRGCCQGRDWEPSYPRRLPNPDGEMPRV